MFISKPWQVTPASSKWSQNEEGIDEVHSVIEDSDPPHSRPLITTGPLPNPNQALYWAIAPAKSVE